MRGDRITGPDRTHLARRLIADREDEIHDRRAGSRELVPAFAAQTVRTQMETVEQFERKWVDGTPWITTGAVPSKATFAPMPDQRFGQDAPGRIAGTQEQDVVRFLDHGFRASTVAETT
jgi:hypothetical protein